MEKGKGVKMAKRELMMFAFILASLAFVNVGCASAATYYVNPGDSIQSAINFANSGDTIIVRDGTYTGDTIIVRDETYTVNILVDKSLTIKSERGYDNCIVQTDDYCTISVEADYVNISGFTLKTTAEDIYMSASTISMDRVDFCNISNNKCSCNGTGFSLFLSNNNIITNNICVNNKNGIHLGVSNNNTVTNNNCSNNSRAGISIGASYYNSIMNNVCANNSKYGIYLSSNSDKNIITNNTCYSNNRGIWVSGSSSCCITNNICSNNMYVGIYLLYTSNNNVTNNNCSNNSGAGISIGASYYNSIMNNVCANNSKYGIYLGGSNGNHIYNNNCSNNNFGIYNKDSNDNRIYCNNCSNNNFGIHLGSNYCIPVGAVNIKDCNIAYLNNIISKNDNGKSAGDENAWYSESSINYSYKGKTYNSHLGNYWGDYEGTDGDGDGIGDAPYVIDDAYRGKDKYPLMEPFENYKIAKFNDSFFEM